MNGTHTLYCFRTVAPHKMMESNVAQTGTPSSCTGRQQISITPGGTRYWIPQCDDPLKPYKGQKFRTLDDAIIFYKTYAYAVGFDVRQSTLIKARDNKTILWKYMVCSREGYKHNTHAVHSVPIPTDGHVKRTSIQPCGLCCKDRVACRRAQRVCCQLFRG
ncbi:FAR1-related protein [Striga asiatica]|uniref:FAR1-related protein n=1 Tax=Striga asiatica TaxID=4170 RepID=A0A5A7Q2K9_STRAF|nr:FAR1-related protein [Striga asiatica]